MDFESKKAQNLRTWILFFVGIGLAILFAVRETPLNPWWTLIIGAFTCTAIIVSAVNVASGGSVDEVKKAFDNVKTSRRKGVKDVEKSERVVTLPNSYDLGFNGTSFVPFVHVNNAVSIQPR